MKVCFITGEYPPMQGGIADYTRTLASTLSVRGVETSILTSSKAMVGRAADQEQSSSFDPSQGDPWPVYPIVDRWNFRAWPRILGQLRFLQPDIVHIQYETSAYSMHPSINLLPLWLRRQRPHPGIVTTLHDLGVPYLFPKAGWLRHRVTLALIRGSDRVIVTNAEDYAGACAVSQAGTLNSKMSEEKGSPKIRIVPIGSSIPVDPPTGFDHLQWRDRLGVPNNTTLLSYFGFLNQSKGVETLLEALHALVDGGMAVKLLMVGAETGDSDPTNKAYMRQIVHRIGDLRLDGQVVWTGYSTPRDISAHLLSSDICVLPFRDGASFRRTTLLTALAHGLPVVSTRGRDTRQASLDVGSTEQIVDGKHALLAAPNNAEGLRQAIEELVCRPETRLRLGEEGRKLAEAFSWPYIARQTLSLYEEALRR